MNIRYLANTEKIIKEYTDVCESLKADSKYVDVPIDNFSVNDMQILNFMICLEPKSISYGRGIGAFVYKDGRVFRFHYNIHTPYSKGPQLSNQMTSIEELIWEVRHGIGLMQSRDVCFGCKAFWAYTPMDYLDEESKALRTLMKALQKYCRKEEYCKKLRKLDKFHERWKEEKG